MSTLFKVLFPGHFPNYQFEFAQLGCYCASHLLCFSSRHILFRLQQHCRPRGVAIAKKECPNYLAVLAAAQKFAWSESKSSCSNISQSETIRMLVLSLLRYGWIQ